LSKIALVAGFLLAGSQESAWALRGRARDIARGVAVRLPGHGLVTVARSVDSGVGIVDKWRIIEESDEGVKTFRQRAPVTTRVISAHILGSFQGSNIGAPETSLVRDWLVHADHVKVLLEAVATHCG